MLHSCPDDLGGGAANCMSVKHIYWHLLCEFILSTEVSICQRGGLNSRARVILGGALRFHTLCEESGVHSLKLQCYFTSLPRPN
jgi:hypothetical protein